MTSKHNDYLWVVHGEVGLHHFEQKSIEDIIEILKISAPEGPSMVDVEGVFEDSPSLIIYRAESKEEYKKRLEAAAALAEKRKLEDKEKKKKARIAREEFDKKEYERLKKKFKDT